MIMTGVGKLLLVALLWLLQLQANFDLSHGFATSSRSPLSATTNARLVSKSATDVRRLEGTTMRLPQHGLFLTSTRATAYISRMTPILGTSVPRQQGKHTGRLWLQQYRTVVGTVCAIALFALVTKVPLAATYSAAVGNGWWFWWNKLRSNIVAGSIIFTLGDLAAQLLTAFVAHRKAAVAPTKRHFHFCLNQQRLAISTLLGVLWAGMANPAIYALVERTLPGGGPADVSRILTKMAMSISVLSTAGNYATMFFRRFAQQVCDHFHPNSNNNNINDNSSSLWKRFQHCVHTCNRDFPEVFKDDLKVWPLYDVMVFSLVPPSFRPISNALMASAWSMYMSIASAKEVTTVVDVEKEHCEEVQADEAVKQVTSISETHGATASTTIVPFVDPAEAKALASDEEDFRLVRERDYSDNTNNISTPLVFQENITFAF